MWNQVKLMKQRNSNEDFDAPRNVEVYFVIKRIGEIDTMNEKFQAEIRIESSWVENEKIDAYDPKKHWNPQLYIENAIQIAKEDVSYKVSEASNPNETIITEVRKVKGFFWERLELNNFPLDLQELSVTLASSLDDAQVRLLNHKTRMSHIDLDAKHTFTDQQKWQLFKHVQISESASYDAGSTSTVNETTTQHHIRSHHTPKIVATCFSARRPSYYFVNAYCLIFLITVLSLCTFSIGPRLPQNRLQITCTLLLTSISFKWVTNRSLPTVSYLTSLDKYAIISIFYLCLLCAWHALAGSSLWTEAQIIQVDKWVLVAFAVLMIGINVWFFIWVFLAYSKVKKMKAREALFLANLDKTFNTIGV